jgi:hypothetical protein
MSAILESSFLLIVGLKSLPRNHDSETLLSE